MINNHNDYENLDDKTHSIYLNPIFGDKGSDEDRTKLLKPIDELSSDNGEQSPYEEVAVNISNTDDPTMLCVTFRSIFIGILLTCFMSFTVQFFAYRTSPLDVNSGIIILLSYILGKLMAAFLPKTIFNLTINPGPFSIKEHAIITIMATSGIRTFRAIEALSIQRLHYNYYLNHFNSILYLILMHFFAISISGILKRYLIWPASMIWPSTLVSCSLIRTLTNEKEFNNENSKWTMIRSKFFGLVVLFQFLWYWFPGYIFPLLSFFSFICMIAPKNVIFSQITGANGLGLGAIELDWNAWVAYLDSPILVPFWVHINIFIGFIFVVWIGTPIIYYLNIWESKKFPIISNRVFDRDGHHFNTSIILNENFRLNTAAYQNYGAVHVTAGYAFSYFSMFAGVSALIVHTILYHGKSIIEQFRSNLSDKKNDIHAKLMSHYPEVSEWWYYIMLILSLLIALILCFYTNLLPGSIMLFSIILTFIFSLPNGIITAVTNLTLTSTAPSEILSSLVLRGNPIGFLTFRTYTYACQDQILIYLANLKISHYMKIPPRIVFSLSILCSIISSIVHYITAIYLLNNVSNICTLKNLSWRCLNLENTYTSSIIFSIAESFSPGSKYSSMLFGFLIGLILPIISWYLWKIFPNIKWLIFINFPIILMATNNLPPAPSVEYPSWFLVGFIFNYILYRYAHDWWEKYAYIFSAGMSCGVAICGIFIFFILETDNIHFPQWWGLGGITGDGCPLASANYSGFIPGKEDL